MTDWDSVKTSYEGSSKSIRAIGREYGTNHTSISKKAEKHGWKRYVPQVKVSNSKVENAEKEMLGKVALRKIEEVRTELADNYSVVDEPLIVMYAKTYERYLEIEQSLMYDDITLSSPKTGSSYINPLFNALQMTQKTLVTIANQLGLSIAARKKMNMRLGKKDKEASLFDFAEDINKLGNDLDV